MEYIFELVMKVRDYECDLQGIVNNANYQHYMEHTRHEFIKTAGLNFSDLHNKGKVDTVCVINGRLGVSEEVDNAFAAVLK